MGSFADWGVSGSSEEADGSRGPTPPQPRGLLLLVPHSLRDSVGSSGSGGGGLSLPDCLGPCHGCSGVTCILIKQELNLGTGIWLSKSSDRVTLREPQQSAWFCFQLWGTPVVSDIFGIKLRAPS